MPNPTKILKERIERLIDLKPYHTIKMKLILDNAIGELNLMIADEMKNLDGIEMKTMMQEGKISLGRIKNRRIKFRFKMKALEMKINVEIEILKNEEKKIRHIIDCTKQSKAELLDIDTTKRYITKRYITDYFKKSVYQYKKYRSIKKPRKRTMNMKTNIYE